MEFGPGCTTILTSQYSGTAFLTFLLTHGSKSFPSTFCSLLLSWLKETTLTTRFSPSPTSAGPFLSTIFHLPILPAPPQNKLTFSYFFNYNKTNGFLIEKPDFILVLTYFSLSETKILLDSRSCFTSLQLQVWRILFKMKPKLLKMKTC